MRITVTPTVGIIEGRVPAQVWEAMHEALRYRDPKAYFTWRGKHGLDDGWRPLLVESGAKWVFPAGLLWRVIEAVHKWGLTYELIDKRPKLVTTILPSDPLPDGTVLYPEQQSAVTALLQAQRGMWALAVNAGKTECAAWLAHAFNDYNVLYLVSSREAMNIEDERSTASRLQARLKRRIGLLGSGIRREVLTRGVVLAMAQTLSRRFATTEVKKLLHQTDVLIIDEADTITPLTWFPILSNCPAPMRVAMSGTIKEHHAPILAEAFTGPIVAEITSRELVDLGRSADPIILMPVAQVNVATYKDMPFDEAYEPGIMENQPRNALIADALLWAKSQGLRSLCLYFRLRHGQLLAHELDVRGVRYFLLSGNTPPHEVAHAKGALINRETDCLIASRIFDRAVNLPEVEVLANAASWKSRQATVQKLGRGLRQKVDGPNQVIVIDPYDFGTALFTRHAEARRRTYEKQGFKVHVGELQQLLVNIPR